MREYETDIMTVEKEYEPDFFEENQTSTQDSYDVTESVVDNQDDYVVENQAYEKKQYDKFEDYSNSVQDSSFEEYEVVRNFAPKNKIKPKKENKDFSNFLDNQYAYNDSTETYIYQRGKEKSTFNSKTRGRIIVYACAFIAILLSTLCIVNLVNITSLNANNQGLQTEISGISKDLQNAEKSADDIKDETTKNNGEYVDKSQTDNVNIKLIEKQQPLIYDSETNFFDGICNFISSIFGG